MNSPESDKIMSDDHHGNIEHPADIQYCCLKCHKNVHIFNNDIQYCINCGNIDIGIVHQLTCNGCLATYTKIEKISESVVLLYVEAIYMCPSCMYMIKNMGPNKRIFHQA